MPSSLEYSYNKMMKDRDDTESEIGRLGAIQPKSQAEQNNLRSKISGLKSKLMGQENNILQTLKFKEINDRLKSGR
jgi:hypothetical protein